MDEQTPKPMDPPPPYPGLIGATSSPIIINQQQPQMTPIVIDPPPPYPGSATTDNNRFTLPNCNLMTTAINPATPQNTCPNCLTSGLVGSVDITLIMCLVLMAFLLTPFTLCCIPCAFRQECPNCGYRSP